MLRLAAQKVHLHWRIRIIRRDASFEYAAIYSYGHDIACFRVKTYEWSGPLWIVPDATYRTVLIPSPKLPAASAPAATGRVHGDA